MTDVYEFYNLGIGDPLQFLPHPYWVSVICWMSGQAFPGRCSGQKKMMTVPKVAIVGKPNVGKSSIINKLLGENRVIVSDIAGTTRDAIDTIVKWNKNMSLLIQQGFAVKNKIKEELERYSIIRTVTAVERADVVVVVIDATRV